MARTYIPKARSRSSFKIPHLKMGKMPSMPKIHTKTNLFNIKVKGRSK